MASTESTTKLCSVLASLTDSLVEFRAESAEIESKFFELAEELGELGPAAEEAATPRSAASSTIDSIAVEHLENLDRSIAEQREEMSGKHEQLSDDVGQLRDLVDRQVQLFTALVNSTIKSKKGSSPRKGNRKDPSEDEVLNEVFSQFEELRGAAATVNEIPTKT